MSQIEQYLWSLTEIITQPPPELVEGFFSYLGQQAKTTENFPPFETIKSHLFDNLFTLVKPEDFKLLNPDGVGGTIQKLTFGRTIKSLKDLFDLFKKANDKLKELVPPSSIDLTKKHWRRTGPFQLMGIDDFALYRSFLLQHIGSTKRIKFWPFSRKIDAPKETDTVTADLAGVTYMLSSKQLMVSANGTLSHRDGSQPSFIVGPKISLGPISWQVSSTFNRLASNEAEFSLTMAPPFIPPDTSNNFWITVVARVNARYYSAIIT